MKKIIAILMVVVIFFSFCACGKKEPSHLVGRWVFENGDEKHPYSIIILYDDGVYLRHDSATPLSSMNGGTSVYGNWEVRDGYLITIPNSSHSYSAYDIEDGKLISCYGETYEKVS